MKLSLASIRIACKSVFQKMPGKDWNNYGLNMIPSQSSTTICARPRYLEIHLHGHLSLDLGSSSNNVPPLTALYLLDSHLRGNDDLL